MRRLLGNSRTTRGAKTGAPPSSGEIIVTLPRLEVDDIRNVDVPVATGLAPIGSPVIVVFPGSWQDALHISRAYVLELDRVRITVSNLGNRAFTETEVPVRLYPQGRRKVLFPEIKFENLKELL